MTSLQVTGTEWVAHVASMRKLAAELRPEPQRCFHPSRSIFHGMVSQQKRALTSSAGALLIDDLTDWIDSADRRPTRALRACAARTRIPERIAAQIALGYFLPHPADARTSTSTPTSSLPRGEPRLGLVARAAHTAARRRAAAGPPRTPTTASPSCSRSSTAATCAWPSERFDVRPLAHYLTPPGDLVPGARARRARRARGAHAAGPQRARARTGGEPMSTLLIDNYDSYTYNVFHLLAAVSGEEPIVVHNDMISWRALSRWDFDAIVLSPGPGRPDRWHDFGVCADILRYSEIPVLGVCLGHQGLGHLLDGDGRERARSSCTGASAHVHHDGSGLFAGIPQGFSVVRYHSLAVAGGLGPEGRVTAWTEEGVVMGIEHTQPPAVGRAVPPRVDRDRARPTAVRELLRARPRAGAARARPAQTGARQRRHARRDARATSGRSPCSCSYAAGGRGAERARCSSASSADAEHAFWLDSADAPTALAQRSFMGTTRGRRSLRARIRRTPRKRQHAPRRRNDRRAGLRSSTCSTASSPRTRSSSRSDLPPGLLGGFVGYLGYECKADCGSPNAHRSDLPDAVLMLANRVIAVDHVNHRTHLVAAVPRRRAAEAERWLRSEAEQRVREALADSRAGDATESTTAAGARRGREDHVDFRCGRGREQYLADIARCQAVLAAGESYEICLTDQIHTDASPDPFELYRLLRRRNPSPFAAYLKLGETAIVELLARALPVARPRPARAGPPDQGHHAPRSADPQRDEQLRRALLRRREDVRRAPDDRRPAAQRPRPRVRGRQRARAAVHGRRALRDRAPADLHDHGRARAPTHAGAVRAGVLPRRLDDRRAQAAHDGASSTTSSARPAACTRARSATSAWTAAVDLNIVIRTIVMRPGATTIGAGGAIVMQSDPEEEFEELLLKARAPMAAIAQTVTGSSAPEALNVEYERAPVEAAG